MLGRRSLWSLPIPALFFHLTLHFCQWALQVHSRINPSAQPGWERKYQWYCTPVSTEEAPFMGQQNLGEASDLISQGGSSSRNKRNQSFTWQSRHSFCYLPYTWAPWLQQGTQAYTHTHTHTHTHTPNRLRGSRVPEGRGEQRSKTPEELGDSCYDWTRASF